ncbi:MAG: AAA family ATPase [Gammaproteobacteria bacterium]|nr:AAA family ATPase [Gammaproteobacteria bacterium]
MEAITGFVGRDEQIAEALRALRSGNSLVIKGRAGIGKSALLRQLHQQLGGEFPCFWLADSNTKAALFDLAEQVHHRLSLQVPERFIPARYRMQVHRAGIVEWEWIWRSLCRTPTQELAHLIVTSLRGSRSILFLESLEVSPTQASLFDEFSGVAQLVAAMDAENRRVRIQRLLWRFQKSIELKPLPRAQVRALVVRWLERRPIRFSSERVRESFIRAVEQESGGVPAAIQGMLRSATNDEEVCPVRVRAHRHEAGVRYLDMTPIFAVGLIGFMAARYVSRGIGEVEFYVLSGVGTVLFYSLTMLMRRLRG